MLILIYLVIVGTILCAVGIGANAFVESRRLGALARKGELVSAEAKLKIAERGLRKIANGVAGSPEFEAQVVLEEIEQVKAIG